MIRRLLALLLFAAPALAADPATMKDGDVLRGRFVQERHLQGFDKPARSEGTFTVVAGAGLIWRAEKPFAMSTVITPAALVQSVGAKETMRLQAAKLPFLGKLYGMMSGAMAGDWSALEAEFSVERQGGTVTLKPRRADPAQPIQAIVAKVGRLVDEVEILRPGGDRDHLVFLDQTLSAGPPTPEDQAALGKAK